MLEEHLYMVATKSLPQDAGRFLDAAAVNASSGPHAPGMWPGGILGSCLGIP
jgi:hypothetical protein